MKNICVLLLLVLPLASFGKQKLPKTDELKIKEVFFKTENAWNEANIDGFMEGYWKSEKLSFVGGNGVTFGWQATRDRYRKAYPDKASMGTLKFTILELSKVDKDTALMIGKFHLTRDIGDMEGHYSLVWKKIGGEWVIISDHSSASSG